MGNDLNMGGRYGRVPHHLPTFENCKWACRETPACVGAVFVHDAPGDNCALKSSIAPVGTGTWNGHCDAWHKWGGSPSWGTPGSPSWGPGNGGCNERRPTNAPAGSGEDVCEGKCFSQAQCSSLGCCHFNNGRCWSDVGQGRCLHR